MVYGALVLVIWEIMTKAKELSSKLDFLAMLLLLGYCSHAHRVRCILNDYSEQFTCRSIVNESY